MGMTEAMWRERQERETEAPVTKAQDPEELFDVLTPLGEPTGQAKPRWQVHRDGDWHRSIHLWICGQEHGVPFLDVQRRGLEKDNWPGMLDATVAGHLRAGEDIEAALREADEEVGLTITMGELLHAGTHLSSDDGSSGRKDREFQEILLARIDQPLSAYRPNADEVDGIARIHLDEAIALLAGERADAAARIVTPNGRVTDLLDVTASDFIPSVDRYALRVALACRRLIAGERLVVV
jgi:isopentenyldiphosphate isomerase